MRSRLLCGMMAATALCLAGCIDVATVVTVDKTGAGTVVETTYMGKAMLAMMDQMGASMGEAMGATNAAPAKPTVKKNPLLENLDQYKKKASQMGEGVTFVSAKEAKKADGNIGAAITYSFKDINKVQIGSEPDMPGGSPAMEAPGATPAEAKNPVTFTFAKGATPKLTISMGNSLTKPAADKQPAEAAEQQVPDKKPSAEEMAQMKQMFDGFRMRLLVKVDGEITKSNATFVDKNPKTNKKQFVTLFDMDIGKLMKDEKAFEKLTAMGAIQDMATAREKMKGMPGLKIETAEKVEIEFQ